MDNPCFVHLENGYDIYTYIIHTVDPEGFYYYYNI